MKTHVIILAWLFIGCAPSNKLCPKDTALSNENITLRQALEKCQHQISATAPAESKKCEQPPIPNHKTVLGEIESIRIAAEKYISLSKIKTGIFLFEYDNEIVEWQKVNSLNAVFANIRGPAKRGAPDIRISKDLYLIQVKNGKIIDLILILDRSY
ncbi:MAG: hypothetical protein ACOZBH_04235 [Patescibacteria group bacterium]